MSDDMPTDEQVESVRVFEEIRQGVAGRVRDWIHEQPWSECDSRADTCPDWDKAYEITDVILGHYVPEDLKRLDTAAALRLIQSATHPEKIVIQIGEFFYWALRRWDMKYEMDPNPHPEFSVRGFPFHHWPRIEGKSIVWTCPQCSTGHPVEPHTARIECACGYSKTFQEYTDKRAATFADFAEPFCAGWNAFRENGDVQAQDFADILMERFRNSGPQRAKRAVTQMEREELRRRLERDLP